MDQIGFPPSPPAKKKIYKSFEIRQVNNKNTINSYKFEAKKEKMMTKWAPYYSYKWSYRAPINFLMGFTGVITNTYKWTYFTLRFTGC